ncbi:MAG TPA: hypothetical protein PKY59_01090, partial [Pyrinomonadaceae bacterium]|nr:hypothetical protein [Pyrinomonadaceae bacterium]
MKESPKENDNHSVKSEGERSVAVGGNVTNSPIHTGDVYNIYAQEPQVSPTIRNIYESKIENLSTELSKEVAAKLEDLRERFRESLSEEFVEGVRRLRNSSNWDAYEPALRAGILRALASMILALKGKDALTEAKQYAAEARQNQETQNDDVLQARIKTLEQGFEAAIDDFAKIKSTESYNLWLNCLLNTGKFSEVLQSRENPPEGVELNAESYRFFALALLAKKNISEAEAEIKKAQNEKPNWLYIRSTAAMIDYCSALSPTVLPLQLLPYPRPFPFTWVKIDDESQRKLSAAADEFENIARQFNVVSRERRECETWHFACVANLFGKQREAIEIGKSLLEKDPTNLQILSWFLFRGYDWNYEKSLKLLQDKETVGNVSLEDLLGLIGIYLRSSDWKKALELIEKRKDVFKSADEINLWRYWRGVTFLHGERFDVALAEEAEITDKDLSNLLKLNIFSYQAQRLNEWKPLIEFLRDKYKKDNDLDAFLSLYEIKTQNVKDEKFVVDNAELYCETTQTASAVGFAVTALWNFGRPQKCLDLLEKYESFFPNNKLPGNLRRLKIHCLIKSDVKMALEEADSLVKDDNNVENIALLMDVHLVKGDLTGLQVTSKKLLQRSEVNVQDLLRAAHLVQVKDPNLAVKFWTRAIEIGVPDDPELVVFAQGIASKLGLEDESRELTSRMMQQAQEGRGPMKMMTIGQLLKDNEKRWKASQEIDQKYGAGDMPLHLLSSHKNTSLAKIFYWVADKNKESRNIHYSPRLFTRHGARIIYPLSDFANSKNWNLHLDITSILLAHKLGILEKLEKLFKPLKISRHTITSLIEQRDGLRPHQKSQLENSQIVADLFDNDKIKLPNQNPSREVLEEIYREVEAFQNQSKKDRNRKKQRGHKKKLIVFADTTNFERHLGDRINEIAYAISENGFAVGFLPLNCYGTKDHSVLRLPTNLDNKIINCRAIVDSLLENNRISEEKHKQVVRSLGIEGNLRSQISPTLHTKLFLMSGVEDVLAGAGVLKTVCDNFEVVISESALTEARNRIQYYKEMGELESSLDELMTRINDGLDEGIYEFIHVPDQKVKKEKFAEGKFGQAIKSTLDLLLFDIKQWDVICIDDRALTKHTGREENQTFIPMISISELLSALLFNGEIDQEKYYELLLELRRSNFRYIPIGDDEIFYHLNLASVKNGNVLENEGLSILRQYHASCLLDKEFLQMTADQFSETPFITQGIELTANAIAKVWKDDKSDDEIKTARADWILDNLYTGNLGCSHLWHETPLVEKANNEINSLAFDICNLLMRGLMLDDGLDLLKDNQKLSRFFDWLNDRVITTRYVSSPEVKKAIARQLEGRFKVAHSQNHRTPQEKLYTGIFMGKFFLNLPVSVAKEINLDQEILNWMKIRFGNTVTIPGANFNADEYWRTIEKSFAGETVSLKSADTNKEYLFLPESSQEKTDIDQLFPTFKVTDLEGNQIDEIQDPSFGIFNADEKTRLEVINKLRSWFDCNQTEFEKQANEIAQTSDSIERVTRFYKVRETSMVYYYRNLEDSFRKREIITWQELMPPSAENLAGYFRLPLCTNEKDISQIWSEAADSLLNEEELPVAISRIASLPVKMPEAVIKRFLQLPNNEKVELLKQLSPVWASPVQLLHLTNLAVRSLPSDNESISEIAKELLSRLYEQNEEADIFAAFHATLSFVSDEFYFWEEVLKLSPEITLAVMWGHATRLYNIQRVLGIEPKNIVSGINNRRGSYFFESLARKPELWNDCVYPRRVSRTDFLTHAAAKIFAGIDEDILESIKIPELIRKEVFRPNENDEVPIPSAKLLFDPILSDNKLESLFGGDRFEALSSIIGIENIEILKSENLKQSLKIYLERMKDDPKESKNWIMVYAIANDLPVYQDLRGLCLNALEILSQNSSLP